MQEHISEIEKLDSEVIAFASEGDKEDVKSTKKFLGITFTLIPTPNKEIIDAFGIRYAPRSNAAFGTIIIDKKGRIRFKSQEEYNLRTSASRIIKELQGI